MAFRSGFVCIIGRPNAGKSTLLNALVGEKLAIISPKPQTTRNRILGIVNLPGRKGMAAAQVVLLDTPGVHRPDSSLGRKMMSEVREALDGCDLILVMVDANKQSEGTDEFLLKLASKSNTPAILVLNKVDLLRNRRHPSNPASRLQGKEKLLPIIERYSSSYKFAEIVPISALKREGLDLLLKKIVEKLPSGSPYFPPDEITDQPARFMAAEAIREQVLQATSEEVPYAVTVIIEQYEEAGKLTRIAAVIYCERQGQKAILLGKNGQMIKQMGTAARLQLEQMLGTKVFLELFVKVRENWRDSNEFIDELDWRRQLHQLTSKQGLRS
jgi:GTP-binding protein Era